MTLVLALGGRTERYHVEPLHTGSYRYRVAKEGAAHGGYFVGDGRCSCPSWTFRRKTCRHLLWLERVGLLAPTGGPAPAGAAALLLP